MPHIFISYAKKDTRQLAENLYHALNAVPGLTAWMDMSLEADSSWAQQIQKEIDRCDYFVVLLSPDVNRPETGTQSRSFVLNEIDYAQQDRKAILPVMAIRTRQPVQIAGIHYIDLTQTPHDPTYVVTRVLQRFNLDLPLPAPLVISAPPPQSFVVDSVPFAGSNSQSIPIPRRLSARLWIGAVLVGALMLVGIGFALFSNMASLIIPTQTPQPTATSTNPRAVSTLDAAGTVVATLNQGLNVRSGPGVYFYPPIGSLAAGETVDILARDPSGDWLKIRYFNGPGWITSGFVTVSGDINLVPIDIGPPTPTLTLPAPTNSP